MSELTVRVRLFAGLRAAAGWSQQEVILTDPATVADLLAHLEADTPSLILSGRPVYAAVNQQYSERTHPLADGDEVALFPPVSGGRLRRELSRTGGNRMERHILTNQPFNEQTNKP